MYMPVTEARTLSRRPLLRAPGGLATLLAQSRAPIIGLAGASGKSATAGLLAAMLREAGHPVTLGLPEALASLDRLGEADRVLVELTPALTRSVPRGLALVVLTGLAADELAPGQSLTEAVEATRRALAGAEEGLVVNADDARALALAAEARLPVQRVSLQDRQADAMLRDGELVLRDPVYGVERRLCRLDPAGPGRGPHATNLMLAAAAAAACAAPFDAIRRVAQAPLPAAPELVARRHRVQWLCDAAATRPGRAAAALRPGEAPTLLIAGGRHGGQPLSRWAEAAGRHARAVLVFGSGAGALAEALCAAGGPATIVRCADLEDAVQVAGRMAQPGERVLFSPACEPDHCDAPEPAALFRSLAPGGANRRAVAA